MGLNIKGGLAKKDYSDLVCLDFGSSSLKAIRLRHRKGHIEAVGAAVLPPVIPRAGAEGEKAVLNLPVPLRANYAACAWSCPKAAVRLLTVPPQAENPAAIDTYVRSQFGLIEGNRMAFQSLSTSSKNTRRVLAAMAPEAEVTAVLSLMPGGAPAPCSLEVAGLSALTAFLTTAGRDVSGETVCLLDTGMRSTYLSFLHQDHLIVFRKCDVGTEPLAARIQDAFEVDAPTAETIISGQSIDITPVLQSSMEFVLRQLALSRDFVEREESSRLSRIYLTGGLSGNPFWQRVVGGIVGLTPMLWNPFDAVHGGAAPPEIAGHEGRFAAALGAGLGVFSTL